MTMNAIGAISAWLQVELGAVSVTADADPRRDAIVFKADLGDGVPPREVEIADETLGDLSTEDILIDLGTEDLPRRLRTDATMRLAYGTDRRVPHFESMTIRCDGRLYRVVRDSNHAVRIFDAHDRPLAKMSSPLPILPVSIFRRSHSKWSEDIRDWRGKGQ